MKTPKFLVGGIIFLASLFPMKEAEGQINREFRYNHSVKNISSLSYPETYEFFNLPWKIKGFNFMDFNNGNYYGKTNLTKNVVGRFGIKSETVHDNKPWTREGLGITATIPTPKKYILRLEYLPIFFNNKGKKVDREIIGYYAEINFPKGFSLWNFGQWDFYPKDNIWSYGELELKKTFAKKYFSALNVVFLGDKDMIPKAELRLVGGVDF